MIELHALQIVWSNEDSTSLSPVNILRYKHHYSCSICLRLRSEEAFDDRQISANRAKGCAEDCYRFCFRCAIANGLYGDRKSIVIRNIRYYPCNFCHQIVRNLLCTWCRSCRSCFEKRVAIPKSRRKGKQYTKCGGFDEPYINPRPCRG